MEPRLAPLDPVVLLEAGGRRQSLLQAYSLPLPRCFCGNFLAARDNFDPESFFRFFSFLFSETSPPALQCDFFLIDLPEVKENSTVIVFVDV